MTARRFHLIRYQDVTGISGTGVVAEGVHFSDGTTIVRWLKTGTARPEHVKPTTVVHEDVESVIGLHGHEGATKVVWLDQPERQPVPLGDGETWVDPASFAPER